MASMTAMPSPPSSTPAAPGVLHLEHFLDSVLKQSLDTVLTQRDDLYTTVAQCAQLRWLMEDMQALSRYHSFIAASTAAEAAGAAAVAPTTATAASPSSSSSSGAAAPLSKRAQAEAYKPPQRNTILVDLGNHFYTPGVVKDAGVIYMNVGCGVVLPMSPDEARIFLERKESTVRQMIMTKSKEALRIKYRIRLVTEAIARLNERQVGL